MEKVDVSCNTCKRCLDLEILDYSQGGCKHTEVTDDFICLAFMEEGKANLMHGISRDDKCECWEPRKRM